MNPQSVFGLNGTSVVVGSWVVPVVAKGGVVVTIGVEGPILDVVLIGGGVEVLTTGDVGATVVVPAIVVVPAWVVPAPPVHASF